MDVRLFLIRIQRITEYSLANLKIFIVLKKAVELLFALATVPAIINMCVCTGITNTSNSGIVVAYLCVFRRVMVKCLSQQKERRLHSISLQETSFRAQILYYASLSKFQLYKTKQTLCFIVSPVCGSFFVGKQFIEPFCNCYLLFSEQ